MKLTLAIILASLLCASCDPGYGVVRYAHNVSVIPSDSCVVRALETIPGMTAISTRIEHGSRPLTLHGIEKPDTVHRFFYDYRGIRGSLFIAVSYNGHATYDNGYLRLLGNQPLRDHGQRQSVIDQLRPALKEVDQALEAMCGMTDLSTKVHESCYYVRCGA
jgi:hypothetical protein